MARIFITGSADGLGQMTAMALVAQGHQVVLHGRNEQRGREALVKVPGAEQVVTGDLSSVDETKRLAESVNRLGGFDVVIHNAGVYQSSPKEIFAVNVSAPYMLTCLLHKPKRLIYLSSGMHLHGHSKLQDLTIDISRVTYSDSKLHVLLICMAVARKWPDVYSNAVDPGWVPTKMGGKNAPDDLQKGYETQLMLAVGNDDKAKVSGCYFYHGKERPHNREADEVLLQERFLSVCEADTGVSFPEK